MRADLIGYHRIVFFAKLINLTMYRTNPEVNWYLGLSYNRFLNPNLKDYGLSLSNNADRLEIIRLRPLHLIRFLLLFLQEALIHPGQVESNSKITYF